MAQATVAVVSQVAAFQGLSEKVQLARCVDCELGVRAHTMKDHKKHVLIPAVFVLIRIEVLGPCHARPFEILQARLGAGHVGLAPHVLSLAQRVEATDHRQQGAVLRQIVRREAGPELHHLVLGGVETPQLLLVMAPWLQGIHVSKDWNVGDRVQHVGECGVMPTNCIVGVLSRLGDWLKVVEPSSSQDCCYVSYSEHGIKALHRYAEAPSCFGRNKAQANSIPAQLIRKKCVVCGHIDLDCHVADHGSHSARDQGFK
mmetsp:Transcript_17356/g.41103  ORF Transcript_17356/g.41103 Transcript_17356/m.41103 type:complete len:258 (+) Transcript_17356:3-776(+)